MHMGHAGGVYRLILEPLVKIQTVVKHKNVLNSFLVKSSTVQQRVNWEHPRIVTAVFGFVARTHARTRLASRLDPKEGTTAAAVWY